MKKMFKIVTLTLGIAVASCGVAFAQDGGDAGAAPAETTQLETTDGQKVDNNQSQGATGKTGFLAVLTGSGIVGIILWAALFGSGIAAIYFIVDCAILLNVNKMIPATLVNAVSEAMAAGDVDRALKACETEPGPLANILSAGFQHVEEGFDVIQEAINTAADIENERLSQHINWISVCGNIAPSLGLLGTVQGMIMAFEGLATGSPDVGALALAISQALWTTAGGLVVSIPAVCGYYVIRNNAARLILRMSALTFELIKDLRHVEVVE